MFRVPPTRFFTLLLTAALIVDPVTVQAIGSTPSSTPVSPRPFATQALTSRLSAAWQDSWISRVVIRLNPFVQSRQRERPLKWKHEDPLEAQTKVLARDLLENAAPESGPARWQDRLVQTGMSIPFVGRSLQTLIGNLSTGRVTLLTVGVALFSSHCGSLHLPVRSLTWIFLGAVVAWMLFEGVTFWVSRRFVVGKEPTQVAQRVQALKTEGYQFVFDRAYESATSDEEGDSNRRLIEQDMIRFRQTADSHDPIHLSIKLTSLVKNLDALDATGKSLLAERLRSLLDVAIAHNVILTIDMERAHHVSPTLDVFEQLIDEEAYQKESHRLGLVLQAYLTHSDQLADDLITLAERRHQEGKGRIRVRLVKGAYYHEELAAAQARQEVPPVWFDPIPEISKALTDAAYERIAERLLQHTAVMDIGFATHNPRTMARVIAVAQANSIPREAFTFQMLFGLGDAYKRQLLQKRFQVMVYAPYGSFTKTMAYLGRRLSEASSITNMIVATLRGGLDASDQQTLIESPHHVGAVRFSPSFNRLPSMAPRILARGRTVGAVIDWLVFQHPELHRELVNSNGELNSWIHLHVPNRLNGSVSLETPFEVGDELVISCIGRSRTPPRHDAAPGEPMAIERAARTIRTSVHRHDRVDSKEPDSDSGVLFLIAGPSGAGRSTLIRKLLTNTPDLTFVPLWTTRRPRPLERDGIDYIFVTEAAFITKMKQRYFLALDRYPGDDGNYYGLPAEALLPLLEAKKDVVVAGEIPSIEVLRHIPNTVSIFIDANETTRLEHLRRRGTESSKEIDARRRADRVLRAKWRREYDYCITNNNPSASERYVQAIVDYESARHAGRPVPPLLEEEQILGMHPGTKAAQDLAFSLGEISRLYGEEQTDAVRAQREKMIERAFRAGETGAPIDEMHFLAPFWQALRKYYVDRRLNGLPAPRDAHEVRVALQKAFKEFRNCFVLAHSYVVDVEYVLRVIAGEEQFDVKKLWRARRPGEARTLIRLSRQMTDRMVEQFHELVVDRWDEQSWIHEPLWPKPRHAALQVHEDFNSGFREGRFIGMAQYRPVLRQSPQEPRHYEQRLQLLFQEVTSSPNPSYEIVPFPYHYSPSAVSYSEVRDKYSKAFLDYLPSGIGLPPAAHKALTAFLDQKDVQALNTRDIESIVYRFYQELRVVMDDFSQFERTARAASIPNLKVFQEQLEATYLPKDQGVAAIEIAVAGNQVGSTQSRKSYRGSSEDLRAYAERLSAVPSIGGKHVHQLADELMSSNKKVLYLLDNLIEDVHDLVLIRWILSLGHDVVVAAKPATVDNDVTVDAFHRLLQDPRVAAFMGVEALSRVRVISSGSTCRGTDLRLATPEFVSAWQTADVIIAKGEGNRTTLKTRAGVTKGFYSLLVPKQPWEAPGLKLGQGSVDWIQPTTLMGARGPQLDEFVANPSNLNRFGKNSAGEIVLEWQFALFISPVMLIVGAALRIWRVLKKALKPVSSVPLFQPQANLASA